MKFNNIFLVSAIVSLSVALSSCYESALEYEGDVNSINSDDGTGSDEGFLASPDLAVGFLRTAQLRVIDAKEHHTNTNIHLSEMIRSDICLLPTILMDV